MSAMTVAPKPVTPVSPSRDTLSVTDNRTGMSYEIPIHEGAIRATELRKIKSGADDFGVVSYDHTCLDGNVGTADPVRLVNDATPVPAGSRAFYYLVAAMRSSGESTLGDASVDLDRGTPGDQLARPVPSPCP